MNFNPSRLTLARKRRGHSKAALSKLAKLSIRSIGYYESGEVEPSEEAISALSRELRFPRDFFFANDIQEIDLATASFRSLSSTSAALRDSSVAAGSLALHLDKWISQKFALPVPSIPNLTGLEPELAASELRTMWGLADKPIRNMLHLVEAHGVRAYSLPIDSSAVDAFSVWRDESPFMFLNSMKSGERSRMDIAHELGHLTLHGKNVSRGRESEAEADRFASAFLMPASDVKAMVPRHISPNTVLKLKKRWRVSAIALVYRLRSLNMITEWLYRSYCIELTKLGYRKGEPGGILRESSQVLDKVFEILRADGITRNMIADELKISFEDLESLVSGIMLISAPTGSCELG